LTYTPILIIHILGGTLGVASGFAAMFFRKGSRRHRIAGDVFVVSMIVMGVAGAWIAFTKSQHANLLAGLLTAYLVSSAWSTVARKRPRTNALNVGLLLVVLATAGTGIIFALTVPEHASTYLTFVGIAALFAIGDVRVLVRGGIEGAQRMVRHIWRMGFALFVATASFFLGTAGDPVMKVSGPRARLFTPAIRATHLPMVPVIAVVAMTLYWIARVIFTNEYRKRKAAVPPLAVALPE
jgi:uncharacterized membrane protein